MYRDRQLNNGFHDTQFVHGGYCINVINIQNKNIQNDLQNFTCKEKSNAFEPFLNNNYTMNNKENIALQSKWFSSMELLFQVDW